MLGILVTLGALWFETTNNSGASLIRERVNNLFYDMHMRINLIEKPKPQENHILIVDLNDDTLHELGRWPWPRDMVAELVSILKEQGAAVIALDIIFPEPEKNVIDTVIKESPPNSLDAKTISKLNAVRMHYEHDDVLGKAIHSPDIIMGYILSPERTQKIGVLPPPMEELTPDKGDRIFVRAMQGYIGNTQELASATANAGFVTTLTDNDGVIRHYPIVLEYKDGIYPSLALSAVKQYLLLDKVNLHWLPVGNYFSLANIQLGANIIPTDGSGQVMIPYKKLENEYSYVSAKDVMERKNNPKNVDGKIVFIGTSATGLGDLHTTPFETSFPGVEIHATVAQTLLLHQFPYKPDWSLGAQLFLIGATGVLFSFMLPMLPVWLTILIPIATITGLFYLHDWLWDYQYIYLNFFTVLINIVNVTFIALMYGFLFETRKRSQLKHMFGQYIPAEQVEKMSESSKSYGFEGESREMSVLFADIRNFTGISENMDPTVLKKFLNEYFTPMTKAIFEHGGTIDKYVGDMIMAFWGAPMENPHHALSAVKTGFEMLNITHQLKEQFAPLGVTDLHIGIGINTGKMNVGDMGSEYRRSYTVLGDSVNLSSRLESSTKFYGTYFIISENTLKQCEGEIVCRHLDKVKVKGKHEAINIYEPICLRENLTPEIKDELQLLTQAQHHYFHAEWDEALRCFEQLHQMYPMRLLYSLYIDRIRELKANGVTAPWDGCFVRSEK
ncbi:MAG: CHASE2 domain-containing protein [Gammaproteobacteria bacterium]